MVQVRLNVGTAQNGSMNALEGSGMASMSEASIDFQPRMEEPSKPNPSSKTSSVSSPMGQLKCCHVPKVSTNLTSTILAPCLRARSMTLRGEGALGECAFFIDCFPDALLISQITPHQFPGRESFYTAASPVSSVRIRIAFCTGLTNIFPSPILPVRAAFTMAFTAWSARLSDSTTSILIFGRKSTVYSLPL